MTQTMDITPVIANESYSPHTQVIKSIAEELTRLVRALAKAEPGETGEEINDISTYVVDQIETLRDAVKDLLGDEFILMMRDVRMPGESVIDTMERRG